MFEQQFCAVRFPTLFVFLLQEYLRSLGAAGSLTWTSLRGGWYSPNSAMWAGSIKATGTIPGPEGVYLPPVDPTDIGRWVAGRRPGSGAVVAMLPNCRNACVLSTLCFAAVCWLNGFVVVRVSAGAVPVSWRTWVWGMRAKRTRSVAPPGESCALAHIRPRACVPMPARHSRCPAQSCCRGGLLNRSALLLSPAHTVSALGWVWVGGWVGGWAGGRAGGRVGGGWGALWHMGAGVTPCRLTFPQLAEVFSRVLGRPVVHAPVPLEPLKGTYGYACSRRCGRVFAR
jgi:hypothetical protein